MQPSPKIQLLLLVAFVIGLVVRLLKSDTRIPVNIPARARPIAAFGLGVIAMILTKVGGGMPWLDAIQVGIGGAVAAIVGHDVVIEGMANGAEIPIPGLMVKNSPPPLTVLLSFVMGAVLYVFGCMPAKDAKFASDMLQCMDKHVDLPTPEALAVCGIANSPEAITLFEDRKMSKITSKPCVVITVDAGPPQGPGL